MRRNPFLDLSLYLVTDPDLAGDRSLLDVVGQAVAGGVSLVQLRNKTADARDLLEQTLAFKALLAPHGVPLVVNDRVDVAAAAGVGCHIGQTDLPPAAARALLGEKAILGLSIDHPDQAAAADPAVLDYVAHGPFAATGTKLDAGQPVGIEGIKHVRELTALPLVAIGGIDVTNAAAAVRAGADGVAVVSGLIAAADPKAAAETLRASVLRALQECEGEQRRREGAR